MTDGRQAPARAAKELTERLLAAGPELEITGWALDRGALEFVLARIDRGRERIIECGSGISTILIARLLRERGSGTVYAIEHDSDWAELMRTRLSTEGLDNYVCLIEAPLVHDPLAAPNCHWYDRKALAALPRSGVDLLLVDGPAASPGGRERSRYPALAVLAGHLRRGADVILDDARRDGEAWVIERWQRELGLRLAPHPTGIAIGAADQPSLALRGAAVRAKARARDRLRSSLAAGVANELRLWNVERRISGSRTATVTRFRARAGTPEALRAVAAATPEIWKRLERIERTVVNHEERIRRLATVEAATAWIAQATLTSEPLISVIVPTRNRSAETERALKSVIAQSHANWELILVQDGPDGTAMQCAQRLGDSRIHVDEIEAGGPAIARNRGLELAQGELIAYLDDDNTFDPGWLKAVAWAFEQRPEIDVLYGGWVIDDPERLNGGQGGALPEFWITPFDRELQRTQALADMSAIAHRRGLAEARFDPELAGYEDWDLLWRLTAENVPLVLPVVAAFYGTGAASRNSARVDRDTARALLQRKHGAPVDLQTGIDKPVYDAPAKDTGDDREEPLV